MGARTLRNDKNMIKTDTVRGLNEKQVEESRNNYGKNVLTKQKKRSFIAAFFQNLSDPIIKILIGAMVLSTVLSIRDINIPETVGIAAAVLIAATVSTLSEYGSEKAFEKLRQEAESTSCFVIRNGTRMEIAESELVKGDLVLIGGGSRIPADCRVISGAVSVDQSPLTGESREIKKHPQGSDGNSFKKELALSLSDADALFKGCLCTRGECRATVISVGDATFLGGVAEKVQTESKPGPLKMRLSELARSISFIGYVAAGMVIAAYLFNAVVIDSAWNSTLMLQKVTDLKWMIKTVIDAVTLGVSVIVVAVPEGLPMMITVVLSSNMKKMLKNGVLVRKMTGIETSGSMNILFCDKTGTLTSGNMSVSKLITGEREYLSEKDLQKSEALSKAAAAIPYGLISSGKRTATEKALASFFKVGGKDRTKFFSDTVICPFDATKKYSACLLSSGGERKTAILGSCEKILLACDYYLSENGTVKIMDTSSRKRFENAIKNEADASSRVMAFAIGSRDNWNDTVRGMMSGLTLVFLISIKDRLRNGISKCVSEAKRAGVRVVMMTGDNKDTAAAIAKEAGIADRKESLILSGDDIGKMTDEEIASVLPRLSVIARASPADKLRLVEIAQNEGLVTGMTGDGVNDAPSLKAADVGFAMGSGSDVAKEAADIILTENSFRSITEAMLFGRTVFASIRKFIIFQLTMNFCAVGICLICPFLGIETPITVIQMLWVNIIMDTLGGIAFAGEVPLSEYMRRPPIKREEKILEPSMVMQIFICASYTLLVCLGFLKIPGIRFFFCRHDDLYFMTCFFGVFIFCGIFNSFNARSPKRGLFDHIAGNKAFIAVILLVAIGQTAIIYLGGDVFRTTPLSLRDLFICALIAFSVIPADMIRKLFLKEQK